MLGERGGEAGLADAPITPDEQDAAPAAAGSAAVAGVLAVTVPALRRRVWLLVGVAALVTFGMWIERFMLLTTALYRDFLPSAWQVYWPTFWDWSLFAGTIGLFFFLFFLFVRLLPMISMFEIKEVLREESAGGHRAAPS